MLEMYRYISNTGDSSRERNTSRCLNIKRADKWIWEKVWEEQHEGGGKQGGQWHRAQEGRSQWGGQGENGDGLTIVWKHRHVYGRADNLPKETNLCREEEGRGGHCRQIGGKGRHDRQ